MKLISREVANQLSSDELRPSEIGAELGVQLAGYFREKDFLSNAQDFVAVGTGKASKSEMCTSAQPVFTVAKTVTTIESPLARDVPNTVASSTIPEIQFHLSFQSRVGPVKWLTPYTDDMLKHLGEVKKVRNLVVVPVSFVSEHIETLEEIDMEYRELAKDCGITNWKRAPALNTELGFIEDLADMVVSVND